MTTKRLPSDERLAVILDAAGRLFAARGYDGARLDAVAAAAGVTKPILYRHVADKEALYLAVLARHRADLPRFTAVMPEQGSPAERVRPVLELWLDYAERHSYAWQMLFRDTGGGPRIEALRREVQEEARAVLARLIAALSRGRIPEPEVQPLAELMRTGMASLVLWRSDHPDVPREAVLDAMTRVWAGLLEGRRGP